MIVRSIIRTPKKSIITASIILMLILILNMYVVNIEENINQLELLPKAAPVYCQITNLNGSRASGIKIKSDITEKILNSGYTEKEKYSVSMMAGLGEFLPEEWKGNLSFFAAGVNCVQAVPGFKTEDIHMTQEEQKDFFESEYKKCVVKSSLMEEKGWKIGDKIPLNLYYYHYDDLKGILCAPLVLDQIEIAGTMEDVFSQTNQRSPDILLPVNTVKRYYQQEGIPFFMDSFSFYVADPFKLNEFKLYMKELGLLEKSVSARDSYQGNSLTVKDSTFISLAENLWETINLMKIFLLPISILLIVIGYVVSFLLMNGRKKDFALWRAMGVPAWKCIMWLGTEQLLLAAVSLTASSAVSLFFGTWKVVASVCGIVLAAYMAGVIIALYRISRTASIYELLVEE